MPPRAGTHLYREVAQRQAAFHREGAHSLAGILHEIARSAAGGHLHHHVERQVFGGDAAAELPVHGDTHGLGSRLKDALRGEHHLHFTGSDAESHSTHCPVCRGVRIATDDGHARQGQSLLRPHYMDNAVARVHHAEVCQSKVTSIASQSIYLRPTALAQSFKSLRAGHLVAIEAVNIELYRAILHLLHHVGVPNLVK